VKRWTHPLSYVIDVRCGRNFARRRWEIKLLDLHVMKGRKTLWFSIWLIFMTAGSSASTVIWNAATVDDTITGRNPGKLTIKMTLQNSLPVNSEIIITPDQNIWKNPPCWQGNTCAPSVELICNSGTSVSATAAVRIAHGRTVTVRSPLSRIGNPNPAASSPRVLYALR
jgi:hypothetical protein